MCETYRTLSIKCLLLKRVIVPRRAARHQVFRIA